MKRFLWGLMAFLSVAVALYALWLASQTNIIRHNDVLTEDLAVRAFALYGHLVGGGIALMLGSFQFLKTIRTRRPALHRLIGRTYVVACLVAAVCGLVMAVNIAVGPVPQAGFTLLALAWFITTLQAYRKARAGDFKAHERWMVRSFALTLAAVSLRFQLPLMLMNGLPFPVVYAIVSFSCWLPNLGLAELYLKARGGRPVAATA